jgi:S-adenosylmethionine hydrolase
MGPPHRIDEITDDATPPYIAEGARFIMGMTQYVPRGTVFVVVIEPEWIVRERRSFAKSKKGQCFLKR